MSAFLTYLFCVNCQFIHWSYFSGVWSVSRFWAKPQWLMQPSSSLTGVNHDFTNWAVIFFFFVVCGETHNPQNLEECLWGVQGLRVPVESSVNDCSESCCLEGLHKHRCAGTLDAWAAVVSTHTHTFIFVHISFLLCPSPQVPFMWLHSC